MLIFARGRLFGSIFSFYLYASPTRAQTCQDLNQTTSSCDCSPGLTNSPTCDTLACGNPFIASSKRPVLDPTAAGDSGSKRCRKQCTNGFCGLGCNICQSSDACKSGFNSLSSGSSSNTGLASSASQDLSCNTDANSFGVGFSERSVNNSTLSSVFPGKFWGTLQRNIDPSSAPLPSSLVSRLSVGTSLTQVWFSPNSSAIPQEQFFCNGLNCAQDISHNVSIYRCTALKCHCLPGTTLCGGGTGISFTDSVNNFKGEMSIECQPNNTTSGNCNFKTQEFQKLFGPNGLALVNCVFGECIQKSIADSRRQLLYDQQVQGDRLSTGLSLGLAFIGMIILALIALVLFGMYQQHQARHPLHASSSLGPAGAACLVWNNLRYVLIPKSSCSIYRRLWSPSKVTHMQARDVLVSVHDRATPDAKSSDPVSIDDLPMTVFSFQSSKYDGRHPKQILRGLSGAVEPGTMMAILGPSGAGKSTFLDILAGQRKAGQITGITSISIPGREGTSGDGITIGLVDQADIISATSTVREALMFAAQLKLPEDVNEVTRNSRVSEVMELLGLSHVAHSKIGNDEVRGLSGGERRRVSIGLEMIAKPSILFLDEPTSGLDSVLALRVINVLKGLSTNAASGCGTTIVCSIHQPSSQIYVGSFSV
ncbi:hypothetical protein CROQUDRAFT_379935 [Cronartium quercuum f. sp. fusiforme G11]|uniref:ABC transporter domain-containing protein n=1 Tax=Cronartium quercuum f. sp. fusiforme G11 TaxID=708437 RepID=A0A9P6NSQ7_9BASI|nr:hypothetical protein CROQUDRAFT_379935 [Cronartium quercuum f. sp. fusiforme G11]